MNKYLEHNDNKTIIKKDNGIESINSTVFLENYNILEYLDGIQ